MSLTVESSGYPVPYHPTWDWMDSSKFKTFSTCERMFFYRYVCGLDMKNKSRHLVIGDAWHKMMEIIGLTDFLSDEDYSELLMKLFVHSWTSSNILEAAYKTCLEFPVLKEAITQAFDYCYEEIPNDLWTMYHDTWSPKVPGRLPLALITYIMQNREADSAFEIVQHEGVPLVEVGCNFLFSGSRNFLFKARWDKVLRNKLTEDLVVREHKTSGNLSMFESEWELAIQPASYAAAIRMLFPIATTREALVEMDGISFLKTKLDPKKDEKDPFRHNQCKRVTIRKDHKAFMIWFNEINTRSEDLYRNYELLHEETPADPLLRAFPMRTNSCHYMYGASCPFVAYCQTYPNPLQPISEGRLLENFAVRFWNPDEHKPPKVQLTAGGDAD